MRITNISEAKAGLSRLVEYVQNSDESIVIGKAGKPVAVLSAFKASKTPRKLGGSWEGHVTITEDFDILSDEWIDQFYDAPIIPKNKKLR